MILQNIRRRIFHCVMINMPPSNIFPTVLSPKRFYKNYQANFAHCRSSSDIDTGELGYDGLNGTRKIGPSYTKSIVYI